VDVGYYAPAARTTLDRVFLCACLSASLAQSTSTSPSTPSLGIDGCVPPPGCGYPRNPTTAILVKMRRKMESYSDCWIALTADDPERKASTVSVVAFALSSIIIYKINFLSVHFNLLEALRCTTKIQGWNCKCLNFHYLVMNSQLKIW